MTTVHVLRAGLPLCEFTTNVPREWPLNHKWLHDADFRNLLKGGKFAATVPNHDRFTMCEGCKAVFVKETKP